MRCKWPGRLSLAILGLVLFTATAGAAEVEWYTDLDEAWRMTEPAGRPILIFVTRAGCKYCVKMKKTTYADQSVAAQINESFVPVVLDAKASAEIAKRFKIKHYPTTLVVDADARLLDRIKGYLPPAEMKRRLEAVQQRYAALPKK